MPCFRFRTVLLLLALQFVNQPLSAKVVSIIDAAGGYASATSAEKGRAEKTNSYQKSASRCEKEGYRLVNGKCVPRCAEGFLPTISSCGKAHRLVEQEGLPACKKCERITCPEPYTFVNDCPDGTTVVAHPGQSGCFKCEGAPCRNGYQTFNVCRLGQIRKT